MSYLQSQPLVEQEIFLGGKVSQQHKIYKVIARLPADYAQVYVLLKKWPDLEKIKDDMEFCEKVLFYMGITENMKSYTELTKLSMILGDQRQRSNLSGLRKQLDSRARSSP